MQTLNAKKILEKRNDSLPGGKKWRDLDFLIWVLTVLAVAFLIRAVIVEPVRVKGSSMFATLKEGDYMMVDKLTYTVSDMQRGDIIILFYPQNNEYSCVKRVIGLPGETVNIINGAVYINGVQLKEDYLTEPVNAWHDGVWTVDEDTVFVLGDNRRVSHDSSSRDVGCVPMERVKGRVRCRLFPFDQIRSFKGIEY